MILHILKGHLKLEEKKAQMEKSIFKASYS